MAIQNKRELISLATKLSGVSIQMTDALLADDIEGVGFAIAVLYGAVKDIEKYSVEDLRSYYNEQA